MIYSPAKQTQTTTRDNGIHPFGYHLAKKMLGADQVNECICRAYRLQEQDLIKDPFHFYRANWRSNVQFPWQLPKSSSASGGRDGENVAPETLFVDVTFDFLLFPTEIVDEGRTNCCHILKKEDFWGEDTQEVMMEETGSIAMSVAIRIGALVAIPSSQCSDNSDKKLGTIDVGTEGDGYQYYYQRGDRGLTVADLDAHCRGIDIVLEDMDSANIASIMGDAFLEGCNTGALPWHVMAKSTNDSATVDTPSLLTTVESSGMAKHQQSNFSWHLKVHHKALEANGVLPLSNNGDTMGESIERCMLDMILLQSNSSRDSGSCVSVPTAEAFMLWRKINPTLARAVEKPVEPSPKKMSPARKFDPVAAAAATSAHAQKIAPKAEDDAKSEIISKPKTAARRPPKPQETVLFARGKRTTLGGSRRKKPKFTFKPT